MQALELSGAVGGMGKVWLTLVVTMWVASGCTLSPYHLQRLDERTAPVPVSGYTTSSGDSIRVECRRYTTVPEVPPPQWMLVDTVVASENPSGGSADLYSFSKTVVFPVDCWGWGGFFAFATEVRFINSMGVHYGVFDQQGQTCAFEEYQAGTPYPEIRDTCELKDHTGQSRTYLNLVVE